MATLFRNYVVVVQDSELPYYPKNDLELLLYEGKLEIKADPLLGSAKSVFQYGTQTYAVPVYTRYSVAASAIITDATESPGEYEFVELDLSRSGSQSRLGNVLYSVVARPSADSSSNSFARAKIIVENTDLSDTNVKQEVRSAAGGLDGIVPNIIYAGGTVTFSLYPNATETGINNTSTQVFLKVLALPDSITAAFETDVNTPPYGDRAASNRLSAKFDVSYSDHTNGKYANWSNLRAYQMDDDAWVIKVTADHYNIYRSAEFGSGVGEIDLNSAYTSFKLSVNNSDHNISLRKLPFLPPVPNGSGLPTWNSMTVLQSGSETLSTLHFLDEYKSLEYDWKQLLSAPTEWAETDYTNNPNKSRALLVNGTNVLTGGILGLKSWWPRGSSEFPMRVYTGLWDPTAPGAGQRAVVAFQRGSDISAVQDYSDISWTNIFTISAESTAWNATEWFLGVGPWNYYPSFAPAYNIDLHSSLTKGIRLYNALIMSPNKYYAMRDAASADPTIEAGYGAIFSYDDGTKNVYFKDSAGVVHKLSYFTAGVVNHNIVDHADVSSATGTMLDGIYAASNSGSFAAASVTWNPSTTYQIKISNFSVFSASAVQVTVSDLSTTTVLTLNGVTAKLASAPYNYISLNATTIAGHIDDGTGQDYTWLQVDNGDLRIGYPIVGVGAVNPTFFTMSETAIAGTVNNVPVIDLGDTASIIKTVGGYPKVEVTTSGSGKATIYGSSGNYFKAEGTNILLGYQGGLNRLLINSTESSLLYNSTYYFQVNGTTETKIVYNAANRLLINASESTLLYNTTHYIKLNGTTDISILFNNDVRLFMDSSLAFLTAPGTLATSVLLTATANIAQLSSSSSRYFKVSSTEAVIKWETTKFVANTTNLKVGYDTTAVPYLLCAVADVSLVGGTNTYITAASAYVSCYVERAAVPSLFLTALTAQTKLLFSSTVYLDLATTSTLAFDSTTTMIQGVSGQITIKPDANSNILLNVSGVALNSTVGGTHFLRLRANGRRDYRYDPLSLDADLTNAVDGVSKYCWRVSRTEPTNGTYDWTLGDLSLSVGDVIAIKAYWHSTWSGPTIRTGIIHGVMKVLVVGSGTNQGFNFTYNVTDGIGLPTAAGGSGTYFAAAAPPDNSVYVDASDGNKLKWRMVQTNITAQHELVVEVTLVNTN